MGALLSEAREEGDDEFWGQAAFAEVRQCALLGCAALTSGAAQEERDEEYVSEAEEADQFDSDFSESEARA